MKDGGMKGILYVGYAFDDRDAPHQAMASFWLARQNYSVDFFAWGSRGPPTWMRDYPQVRYRLFPRRGLFSAIRFAVGLFLYVLRNRPNNIIVQGAQQTPLLLWLPWFKKKACVTYYTQDFLGPGQHWLYEWSERFFSRRADHVIVNEVNRARFMASSYRLNRYPHVIRTALPSWWAIPARDESYRSNLLSRGGIASTRNPRLIVAGGKYALDRMSSQLIAAFARLPENFALVFTGMDADSSSRKACEVEMIKVGVHSRIIFLERLGHSELLRLYAAGDLGILLYPNSGLGHFYQAPGRLTEYLRCGLPVVTSNFPGLELLTLKYQLGEAVDPKSPSEIAEAIKRVAGVTDEGLKAIQSRLALLAKTELAYEAQAAVVFGRILGVAADRAA